MPTRWPIVAAALAITLAPPPSSRPPRAEYAWSRETDSAAWDGSYIFSVFVVRNEMWALHPRGNWSSRDGGRWVGSELPASGLNSAYQQHEVWSSADGVHWDKSPDRSGAAWGGAPVVYDDQLWLIAANRNSTFAPALLVTADGATWREDSAPRSPRGAPAVFVFDNKLFMAGGKYSVAESGAQRFIYRNDVWSMSPRPR
jgi:hypothetical protein